MSFLLHTSGSVGGLGGQPPRSTRPNCRRQLSHYAANRACNSAISTSIFRWDQTEFLVN